MKKIKKNTDEEKMYPVVRSFLIKSKGCTQVFMDHPESTEKKIHLKRALSIRDPDIVGVHSNDIYIAEGKLLKTSGTAFDDCMNQLTSLELFGHYFFAFFLKKEWDMINKKDILHFEEKLRKHGIGLLLVNDKEECIEIIPARRNQNPEESKIAMLRKYWEDNNKIIISKIDTLSNTNALIALKTISILALITDTVIVPLIKKVFNKKKNTNCKGFVYKGENEMEEALNDPWVTLQLWADKDDGKVLIEIDPFGYYSDDGRPCVWIFAYASNKWQIIKSKKLQINWEYVNYVMTNDETNYNKNIKLLDFISLGLETKIECFDEFWLAHRIDCFGSSVGSIKSEVEDYLEKAKTISKLP